MMKLSFIHSIPGGLAQLARALAWHARGHRFDPDILHLVREKGRMKSEESNTFTFLLFNLFTFTTVFDILIQAKL